jgi:hypothetical protein
MVTSDPGAPVVTPSYAERAERSMARALDYCTDGAALAHALWWFLQARTWSALDRRDFTERDVCAAVQKDLDAAIGRGDPDPAWHLAVNTAAALDLLQAS